MLALQVHPEDLDAILEFGERNDDLAIETPGSKQGGIEDVGPVGGRHHHDALGALEAVHLGEHLVEGLLSLVVSAAEASAAFAADGVDLVDEDDRLPHLASRFEQVAHAAGADAHEHLHEVRTGDREEWHSGLAGDCLGEEGLAGAGWADEQHAFGDARTDFGEAFGVLQEVDDLRDFLLDAVVAGDVVEHRSGSFGGVGLGLASANRHDVAHLPRGPTLHPHEEEDEQGDRDQQWDQRGEEVGPRGDELPFVGLRADERVVVVWER